MVKHTKRTVANIVATLAFAAVITWIGMYISYSADLCDSCGSLRSFAFGTLISSFIVLITFFIVQYKKTIKYLLPRKRPELLPFKRSYATFKSAGDFLWEVGSNGEVDKLSVALGWELKYDNETTLIVYQDKFYFWLLQVCKLQTEIRSEGKDRVRSPLSVRLHWKLGREKLKVYKQLLWEAEALEQVNRNVVKLKDCCMEDPWGTVIKNLEDKVPTIEI